MSGDIVERLRRISGGSAVVEVTQEAADKVERLRAAGDAMADNFRRHVTACGVNDGRESLSAWEEACREQ